MLGRDALLPLAPWLLLILAAEFVNGWTDAPNAIATVVSTRVMRPHHAVLMAAVLNAAGAFAGTAVAATIGKGIIRPGPGGHPDRRRGHGGHRRLEHRSPGTTACPPARATGWWPGSPAPAWPPRGWDALQWEGWRKVLIGIVFSTFLGFFFGLFFMIAILWIARRWAPGTVKSVFGRLQILSAAFMAFSHGSNDGQKFMGVFTLALMLGGALPKAECDASRSRSG